jgi:hypothetical protein
MTCCTSPDVNLAEEVKFRPIECDRRLCGDFSLRRTNLPANADELLRRFRARALPRVSGFLLFSAWNPLRERPCAQFRYFFSGAGAARGGSEVATGRCFQGPAMLSSGSPACPPHDARSAK